MYLRNSTRNYTKAKTSKTTKANTHTSIKKMRTQAKKRQSLSSQKKRFKLPYIVSKKGKRKTTVEFAQSN